MKNIEINKKKLFDIVEEQKRCPDNFPRIVVFVISYKAGNLLRETLKRIPEKLFPVLSEIFIVDDFSDDDTYEIGKAMSADNIWKNKLKVFKNPRNYGYGGNQKIGYRYAIERNFDFVILLHGDGQYAPEFLPDMIWPVIFKNKKVVFGSRMINGSDALKGGMPIYKFVGNKILTNYSNIVLNMKLSEFHSGYRLYSCDVLRNIPFEENTEDFHFDTQIIIQCKELGIEIFETPIPTYYGDEICRVNGVIYALNIFKENIIYRLQKCHIIRVGRYIIFRENNYTVKMNKFSSHIQISRMIQKESHVLDVGCGSGFLAKLLKKKRVQVYGVDVHENKGSFSHMREYFQVNLNEVNSLPFNRKFDAVVVADVLEHLVNDSELLITLKKFIKPEGRLIASTGNISIWFYRLSLLFGRFQYGDKGILDKTHVRLYTPATWNRLIRSVGFKILKRHYTPIPFELFISPRLKFLTEIVTFLYQGLVRIWPTMFAYQVIVEAELESLDFTNYENLMDMEMLKLISNSTSIKPINN